jgi:hypothetical protein
LLRVKKQLLNTMVRLLPLPLLSHEETLEQQALLELQGPQVLKAHRVSKANPELLEPQVQLAQQAHKGQRAIKAIQGTLGLRELLGQPEPQELLEPLAPELQLAEPQDNF